MCSGWREGLDLVLRDQTVTAEATVKRRQNIANKSRSVSPSVPRFLIEDEESRALTFFVSSWVLFPHDPKTDHGITELLPYFFGDLKSGKSLYLALAATSRLLFAAWELRIRDIETPRVKVAYGKALKATRLALEDPIECSKDETLMSVLLLGLYEVRISRACPPPSLITIRRKTGTKRYTRRQCMLSKARFRQSDITKELLRSWYDRPEHLPAQSFRRSCSRPSEITW